MTASYSLTEQLAKHLQKPVADATRMRARLHLLDWLACVAGALRSDVAASLRTADVRDAAWLGNVLEMDDVHRAALLHPGPAVWPAALDTAYEVSARMDEMLDAAIWGYEAMIAVGATFDAHHYAHFHNTATAGVFGAAACAGSLYDLTEEELVWAFGNAGSTAGGLWQMRHENIMTKQWHLGQVRGDGTFAALMAKAGVSGPRSILEGPQGLYAATCREPKPMTFPNKWRIHEVSFKPWAACRHAHPVIDCILELKEHGSIAGPITVETYADAITFCDRKQPETEVQAKFSLQHAVAVAALSDPGDPANYTVEAIARPDFAALRDQVKVCECTDISARFPEHFGARVTVGGRTIELIDTRGDPERPLSEDGLHAKVHSLFKWGGLNWAEANKIIALCLEGDDPDAIYEILDGWLT
jgi:2-methylcitrate dehydratase PrpD